MFDEISSHLLTLPPLKHRRDFSLATEEDIAKIEKLTGESVSPALRWWLKARGAGMQFSGVAVYPNPKSDYGHVGVLMGISEMCSTHDDIEDRIERKYLPFNDDSSGNWLVVANDGVFRYLHDQPSGRNRYAIAPSFEAWLLSIRGDDESAAE